MIKRNIIMGIGSLILLIVILVISFYMGESDNLKDISNQKNATIIFEDDLVYDGSGELDLLQGVIALDNNKQDITSKIEAIIVNEGDNKKIRYSVTGRNNNIVTTTRNLILKNYQGPSININNNIQLQATNLSNLIQYLDQEKRIQGLDGFGKDITNQITYYREKIDEGYYLLTFNLNNEYLDHTSITINANITGNINDPQLSLIQNTITISLNSEFYPEDYIDIIDDGSGNSNINQVEITSTVDVYKTGTYYVYYQLHSNDYLALANQRLKVIVK